MANFVLCKLNIDDNEEDIKTWLRILTVGQGQNLLNSLILKKQLDKVLEYLLKKNGQWTDISQKVMDQSSEEMKKVMASRLINKQIKFDQQDEIDDIVVQLVASTDGIMQQLWNDMETEQKISLLLEIMTPDQTKFILEEL